MLWKGQGEMAQWGKALIIQAWRPEFEPPDPTLQLDAEQ